MFNIKEFLVNEQIKSSIVEVIGDDGQRLGQMSREEAMAMAEKEEKDLVLVGINSNPPICKMLDYSKFKFEMAKKEKEARKKQKVVEIKEIRLSATIDTHDLEIKAKNANKFLKAGDKVKISLRFKGRELTFVAKGRKTVMDFLAMLENGIVDKEPRLEGKFLNVVVSPKQAK